MRARLLIAAAALAATSCIEIDNDPLRFGGVRGQVAGADPALALAVVLNQAGLQSAVDASGSFAIREVPAGDPELLVIATSTSALRVRAHVDGGRWTDLGVLTPDPAAFIDVRLAAPDMRTLDLATISLDGTQYVHLPVDVNGHVHIGPLGAGIYDIEAEHPDYEDADAEVSVGAGQTVTVPISFEPLDGG